MESLIFVLMFVFSFCFLFGIVYPLFSILFYPFYRFFGGEMDFREYIRGL